MIKHKDNFTDAVDALDKNRDIEPRPEGENQQVVNNDGEIVTLGQNGRNGSASSNKRVSVGLSDQTLQELGKIITKAVKDGVKEGFKKYMQKS